MHEKPFDFRDAQNFQRLCQDKRTRLQHINLIEITNKKHININNLCAVFILQSKINLYQRLCIDFFLTYLISIIL